MCHFLHVCQQDDPVTNLNNAFEVAERYLDIPKMLDAEGKSCSVLLCACVKECVCVCVLRARVRLNESWCVIVRLCLSVHALCFQELFLVSDTQTWQTPTSNVFRKQHYVASPSSITSPGFTLMLLYMCMCVYSVILCM